MMGLLSLEETEKAGPDAELTAVSSNTPWQETPPQKQGALGKTVHSLIRVFATRGGQIPQPSPEQRLGEGR